MSDDKPPCCRLPVTHRDSFTSDPIFEATRVVLDQSRQNVNNLPPTTDTNTLHPSPREVCSLLKRLHEESVQTLQPAAISQDPQTVPIPSAPVAPTQHQCCGMMCAKAPVPDPTYGTSVGSPSEKQTLAIVRTPAEIQPTSVLQQPAVLQSPTVIEPTDFMQSPAVMQPSAIVQVPAVMQQPGVTEPPLVQPNRDEIHEKSVQTLQPAAISQVPQTVPIPSALMAPTQQQVPDTIIIPLCCRKTTTNTPIPDPTYGTNVGSPTVKQTLAVVQTPAGIQPTSVMQQPAVLQSPTVTQPIVCTQCPAVKQPSAVQPNRYEIILKMKDFRPEDIVVTVDDNIIDITAVQEKIERCSMSSRSMKRRYTLPSNVIPETIQCDLSCDGVLVISAPWAF